MKRLLTKELLLKKQELKIEKVELDAGFVYLRELSGKEREDFETSILKREIINGQEVLTNDLSDFRAKLLCHCLCDEEGIQILNPQKDAKTFSAAQPARVLAELAEKASILNGIDVGSKQEQAKN